MRGLAALAALVAALVVLIALLAARARARQRFDAVYGADESDEARVAVHWGAYTPGCGRFRDRAMCTGLTSGGMPAIEQAPPPLCAANLNEGCCRVGEKRGNLAP